MLSCLMETYSHLAAVLSQRRKSETSVLPLGWAGSDVLRTRICIVFDSVSVKCFPGEHLGVSSAYGADKVRF